MKIIQNLIGGLAGAIALNILHETIRRVDADAPRIDLVGKEGVNKIIGEAGVEPLTGNALYAAALASDVVSNTLYYSLIGSGKDKYLIARGAFAGMSAGIGALRLTKPMGLSDAPVTRSPKTQMMTVGYYLAGGLVTAFTIRILRRNKS